MGVINGRLLYDNPERHIVKTGLSGQLLVVPPSMGWPAQHDLRMTMVLTMYCFVQVPAVHLIIRWSRDD